MDINKKYTQRLEELRLDRLNYITECKDITDYILPQKGIYTSEGEKPHKKTNRFSKIIDPIATDSNDLLASGIQGGLSSPSRPWFRLVASDSKLMAIEEVRSWLDYVESLMYSVLNNSNFYQKIHEFYGDEGAFGTSLLYCNEDFKDIVRFKICAMGEYYLDSSIDGRIDTVYRRFHMRARNVVEIWPNTVSKSTKNISESKPYEWIDIVHVIEPNTKRNPNKSDKNNMPYKSVYFELDINDKQLSSGGFQETPFAVGRWSVNEPEVYGVGPGHVALGLVKMLQSMQKTSLKAVHKEADPPMRVPAKLKETLNQLPGGINYVASNEPKEAIGRLFDMNFDYNGVENKIVNIKESIQRIFKRDLFLLITDRPEMTATEVNERSQEKLILIGPVIERQIHEVLSPVLERTYAIMSRANMIPAPPVELQGGSLEINYVSLLAQAQKMIGLQGMRSYLETATAVAQINPDSTIKTNWNQFLDNYADSLSLASNITRDDETVDQITSMLRQMEQMAQQIEMLKSGTEAAKTLSETDTSGDNALTQIIGALQ